MIVWSLLFWGSDDESGDVESFRSSSVPITINKNDAQTLQASFSIGRYEVPPNSDQLTLLNVSQVSGNYFYASVPLNAGLDEQSLSADFESGLYFDAATYLFISDDPIPLSASFLDGNYVYVPPPAYASISVADDPIGIIPSFESGIYFDYSVYVGPEDDDQTVNVSFESGVYDAPVIPYIPIYNDDSLSIGSSFESGEDFAPSDDRQNTDLATTFLDGDYVPVYYPVSPSDNTPLTVDFLDGVYLSTQATVTESDMGTFNVDFVSGVYTDVATPVSESSDQSLTVSFESGVYA